MEGRGPSKNQARYGKLLLYLIRARYGVAHHFKPGRRGVRVQTALKTIGRGSERTTGICWPH